MQPHVGPAQGPAAFRGQRTYVASIIANSSGFLLVDRYMILSFVFFVAGTIYHHRARARVA